MRKYQIIAVLLCLGLAGVNATDSAAAQARASFDAAAGELALHAGTDATPISLAMNAAGRWETVGLREKATFEASALKRIVLTGAATLNLNQFKASGLLRIDAVKLRLEGSLSAEQIEIMADDLTLACRLDARAVSVRCTGRLATEASAEIVARHDGNGGRITFTAPHLINGARLDATGATGGQIECNGEYLLNHGTLLAGGGDQGGAIKFNFVRSLVETASGRNSVASSGAAGRISFNGGLTGTIFTSGTHDATGGAGGRVQMLGKSVTLMAARLDASGESNGGTILVGGDRQGRNTNVTNARDVQVNATTVIRADARRAGNGGTIIVWADNRTECAALLSARGGPISGNGGFIEVSGKEQLLFAGIGDAGAAHGRPGTLLMDPKNLGVANSATLPQFELIDPTPVAGDEFGGKMTALDNGNVVVVDAMDDTGFADAGAIHLFNATTGALISTVVGAAANDRVGLGIPFANEAIIVSADTFIMQSVKFNGDRGAITWFSSTTGLSGTVGAANSLLGAQPNDFDTVVVKTLSGPNANNYVVGTGSWNAGVGAATWFNGTTDTPIGGFGALSAANSLIGTGGANTGYAIIALSNGNYIVQSSAFGGQARGGITYGNGATGLTGTVSAANSLIGNNDFDSVGSTIIELANGHFVAVSTGWGQGINGTPKGAVTWCNGTNGQPAGGFGVVSATNSVVGVVGGGAQSDGVGSGGVIALPNSNYFIVSPGMRIGAVEDVGAVTWVNGTTGLTVDSNNAISAANSLIGTAAQDGVGTITGLGSTGATIVGTNNVVVTSPLWNNGATADAGAATWMDGATGLPVGAVSAANSLVGTNANDQVSSGGVATKNGNDSNTISNGNYVVCSSQWNGLRGAVTFGSGATGIVGAVAAGNSLIGAAANDQVSNRGVTVLSNGNYVIGSSFFNSSAGAVTWGNGTLGHFVGTLSLANSRVGAAANDGVGNQIFPLPVNGNFVVLASGFGAGGSNRGAAIWGDGTMNIVGTLSVANSLYGGTDNDGFSDNVRVLPNGNYLYIKGTFTSGGAASAGAVTWCDGTTGRTGVVDATNSLVGSTAADFVGNNFYQLTNGNYLLTSTNWNNGAVNNAGAVTFGNAATGHAVGAVSAANSLVGTNGNEQVGQRVATMPNGNYLVGVTSLNNNRGAIFLGNGTTGLVGTTSTANSVTGANDNEQVGNFDTSSSSLDQRNPIFLSNGNLIYRTSFFDNGATQDVGAMTWISGTTGQTVTGYGAISTANSIVGGAAFAGNQFQRITAVSAAGVFFGQWTMEGSGRVRGGFVTPSTVTYASVAGSDLSLSPAFLKQSLDAGTNVVLQANNDITISDAITVTNAGGDGGSLTLQAGRSVLINANITTDNGALTIIANDTLANGVVDANRDAGAAEITVANGITLDAGTGALTVDLRNGAGKTNLASGDVTLRAINAGTLSVTNAGPTAGSDILPLGAITAGTATFTGNLNLGTLTTAINGNLVFAAGSTLSTIINGATTADYGRLTVTGTVTMGNATLAAALNYTPGTSDTINLIDNDGADAVTGTFNGLAEGATVTLGMTDFTVRYAGGTGNDVTLSTGGGGGTAPVVTITSGPTATPNPAGVGQTVTFGVVAADSANSTLTYSWNIAGTVVTGAAPTMVFTTSGVYTAMVTVTNGATGAGGTATGSVQVTVNAPVAGTGSDSDGDGFSDAFETAAGTNPNSAADSPTGGVAPTTAALTASKLSVKLNFAKANSDTIKFNGTLPVPAGYQAANKTITVDIGGVVKAIKLDATGKSKQFKAVIKAKKGVVPAQTAKFSVNLPKGAYAAALTDEGLTNADVKNANVSIVVRVVFNSVIYEKTMAQTYNGKADKSGSTKDKK